MLIFQFEDRRIFFRFSVNLSLKYYNLNSKKDGEAKTCDISAGGIGFLTDEELPPSAPLDIWLLLAGSTEPLLYTKGEVIWSKMVNANSYRVGINLEKPELIGISRIFSARKNQ